MQILLSETAAASLTSHAVCVCVLSLLILDEELPDYIMVMVANKKTSQQMADDLSLFLGNNTIKFTAWYDQNKQRNVYLLSSVLLFLP